MLTLPFPGETPVTAFPSPGGRQQTPGAPKSRHGSCWKMGQLPEAIRVFGERLLLAPEDATVHQAASDGSGVPCRREGGPVLTLTEHGAPKAGPRGPRELLAMGS